MRLDQEAVDGAAGQSPVDQQAQPVFSNEHAHLKPFGERTPLAGHVGVGLFL